MSCTCMPTQSSLCSYLAKQTIRGLQEKYWPSHPPSLAYAVVSAFTPSRIGAALREHSAQCVSRESPPCWGRRPRLIRYLLSMIAVSAEETKGYGGMTLKPDDTWHLIKTGSIWSFFMYIFFLE